MSASSHTRGHRFAPEMAEAKIAWLERHNRRVVNGSRALRLEVSKVNQYMALDAAGIRTPKTVAVSGKEQLLAAASAFE
ncbi:alpha-L-glutamate ligase, partial [Streptococcus pneumoniae]|nr:alpha-L-glutamate ligase [Streptococcus pneumoniae]